MADNDPVIPPRFKLPPARGGAQFFDTEYQVQQLTYPEDLMAPPEAGQDINRYGGNFVVFYINVHEDSYLVKDADGKERSSVIKADITPREAGNLRGSQYSTAAVGLVAAGAGAAAATAADPTGRIVGAVEKVTGGKGAALTGAVKTVGNVLVGGAVGAAAIGVLGGAKNDYKRLKTAIALNVPTDLSVRYSANWEEDAMAGTAALLDIPSNITSPGTAATSGISYLAGAALKTPGIGGAASKITGVASNPKKEQIFQQVDFRTFTFTYQFFPRSAKEAQQVRNIIKTFKLHMHPEYKQGTNNFLFVYPSEFDIFYYHDYKENLNLHRHTSCVLTDLSVMYTPQGQFTSFDNGMPSQINMTLTFKELAVLTKENIEDGF